MSNSVSKYIRERKPKPLCLGYVTLTVQCSGRCSEGYCLEFSERDLKKAVKDRHVPFAMESLRFQVVEKGVQISFWGKSGLKPFKPLSPFKNCVEYFIFGFTTVVLRCIKGECTSFRIDMHYITDLSPCDKCVEGLPLLRRTLKADFPNIRIREEFVISYDKYLEMKQQGMKTWAEFLKHS